MQLWRGRLSKSKEKANGGGGQCWVLLKGCYGLQSTGYDWFKMSAKSIPMWRLCAGWHDNGGLVDRICRKPVVSKVRARRMCLGWVGRATIGCGSD